MRICANKIGTGVRCSALLPNIRSEGTRQFASAQQINQLEGLAVAIPWGFESPLPHHLIRLRLIRGAERELRHPAIAFGSA